MKNLIDLLKTVFCGCLFLFAFAACEKDDPVPAVDPIVPTSGVFILNQGSYSGNDAGISYYDFKTGTTAYDITGGKLGDTGQDMIVYGSKLYVAVSESSTITVIDLQSAKIVETIAVENNNKPRKPRYLTSYAGKVYASTFDGNVIRIDTAALAIEAVTKVGPNPDGIAAANGKLYVANTNGLDYPNFDNTVSVVDIATFKETKKITVGLNPNYLLADAYENIYLTYRENNDGGGGMQKIDTKTDLVTNLTGISANQTFTIVDDILYYFDVAYDENYIPESCTFGRYNVKTAQKVSGEIITDGTKIGMAYAIDVDPENKDVYISDANYTTPGKVYIYGSNGVRKKTLEVGILACKFVFK